MKRAWIAIGLMGLAGATGAGIVGFRAWRTHQAHLAWSRFATCLIGVPLAPGESLPERVTGIRRATHEPKFVFPAGGSGNAYQRPAQAWPDRCAPFLLAASRSEGVLAAAPMLGLRADEAVRALRKGEVAQSVYDLWNHASALPFATPVAEITPPPQPRPVLVRPSQSDQPLMPHIRLTSPSADAADSRAPIVFGGGRYRCTMSANLSEASCAPVSDTPGANVHFIPAMDGHAWVVSTPQSGTLFGPDGRKLAGPLEDLRGGDATNVSVHGNDGFTDLTWMQDRAGQWAYRLQRWSGGNPIGAAWLPFGSHNAAVLGEYVAWVQDDRLQVAALVNGTGVVEAARTLGRWWKGTTTRVCTTAGLTYVLAIHRDGRSSIAPGSTDPALMMDLYRVTPAGWTGPEPLDAQTTSERGNTVGPVTLSCGDGFASIGWALSKLVDWVDQHELRRLRCGSTACAMTRVELSGLGTTATWYNGSTPDKPGRVEGPVLVDLGDKAAVLWNGGGSARIRVGEFGKLPEAAETALLDTLGGEFSFAVVVRDKSAVVMATDGSGGRVFSVDPDGRVSAVKVKL